MWVSNPDRTRSFVNRAYVDFLGLDYEAAAKLDWRTILHPDDHDRIVAESIAGEASLKPFTLEARYRGRDGGWRWIRSTSQPRWGPEGEVNGFIGVAHDVTAAKEAEQALREINETLERRVEERTADLRTALDRLQQEVADRERAEDALRQAQKMDAVGQLTGGIAHDFNNLLTPIIGGLELITRRIDDERLKRIAQAALESGQRGAKLATQLLAFSRLQRITMAPVEVNGVIEEMGRILHHSIGPRIEIRKELSDEVLYALCDANQLENALLNLAINARDAMPEGGCLTISTGLHEEPQGPDLAAGTYVCVTVEDSGEGMTPEVLARALEPFFSTKPVGKGTGLGLAQVYGIAQQSGGTVRIHSKIGEGTKVHMLLPRVDAAEPVRVEGAEAVARQPEASARAEILVIDDDPEVRAFLNHALVELGHQVIACDCAEAGLEQLARGRPDLALIDFAMPGMNGAQLALIARERHPGLRIAFVTGYAETEQLEAALGSGAAVLRKPFTMNQLAEIIARKLAPAAS
jgi:PAS domain S-box-containing protein